MNSKKREFYIVDKEILPTSIQKVIEVNELISQERISIYEAIKRIGISRSTYYKYKDYVKPFFEETEDRVFNLYLSLKDKPGVLSKVLDIVGEYGMNVLTIIQNIPVDNIANTTISLQTAKERATKVEEMLEDIKMVKGIKDIRIIGNN